jgi:hypothetical protein
MLRSLLSILLLATSWPQFVPTIPANKGAGGGGATPAFIQGATNVNSGSTNSVSKAFGSNTTAGSIVIVMCVSNTSPTSLAVTGNFTYTADGSLFNGAEFAQFFYSANVAGGAETPVCTGTGNHFYGIAIAEFSNVAHSSPVDLTASWNHSGTNTTAWVSSSVSTSTAGDLVIMGCHDSSISATFTAGTNFTLPASLQTTGWSLGVEYYVPAGTLSSFVGGMTSSVSDANWDCGITAFKHA